jgi:hypothetical protein
VRIQERDANACAESWASTAEEEIAAVIAATTTAANGAIAVYDLSQVNASVSSLVAVEWNRRTASGTSCL